ncbi:hypothetical protein [Streptomyces natalensis]|uniref:Uncharacterized protein n=1 Tax=Streptomyces natalensis ATCC 27448 TaxID=1240678 RepID=A0A0D7CQ01_9ACTN|nr:hypothetical protein [Streptomyces natalensis]KIZ17945.1 hypothetical protein SNA_11205 [Streptomyces natalensis ATCC 27448]
MSTALRSRSAAEAPGLRRRLPWWAPALPVLSFVALLALISSPSPASAADAFRSAPAALLGILARLVGVA